MLGTAMPKAAIYEDSHAGLAEDDIRTDDALAQAKSEILAKPAAAGM
jgi:hypothetical protein